MKLKTYGTLILGTFMACGTPPDTSSTPASPIFASDSGIDGGTTRPSDGGLSAGDGGRPDAGLSAGDGGQPDAGPPRGKRIFISSQAYDGDFTKISPRGSTLDAADELCTTLARGANLSGAFKAWLSSQAAINKSRAVNADAIDRIADVGPWYQFDSLGKKEIKTFNNKANLLGSALERIRYDERGLDVSSSANFRVWTGSNRFGRALETCEGFTSSNSFDDGSVGKANVESEWNFNENVSCYRESHLICLEQ